MQNLSTKTSLIIVVVVFLVGVALSAALFSASRTLPVLEFPIGFKVLFELVVYLVSLFLFSNYKIKPNLWVQGFLIILFFRLLFSIMIGTVLFMLFAQLHEGFGEYFFNALYINNYVFIVQVLLSPCLAYPLLVAVITEKVEREKAEKEEAAKPKTANLPPPPPKTELPPEWLEDFSSEEEASEIVEKGKSSGEISSELLKELGLEDLAEEFETEKKPQEKPKTETPESQKPSPSDELDAELKALLGELNGKSFFGEGDKEPEPIELLGEEESLKDSAGESGDELLKELAELEVSEEIKPLLPDEPNEALEMFGAEPKKLKLETPPEQPSPEILPDEIELPAFEIPGAEELPKEEAPELGLPELEVEMPSKKPEGEPPVQKQPEEPPLPEEPPAEDAVDIEELIGDIPPPPLPPIDEQPPLPEVEPPKDEIELPNGIAEEVSFIDEMDEQAEPPEEEKPDLDEFLKSLGDSDLPDLSFDEKPIVSLDDLPPLPDFPGMPDEESEQAPGLPLEPAEDEKPPAKETDKKGKTKPAGKGLAEKPSDTVTISVRRIIDYGKTSEASAVLNKLLRRGSDYKLQVPLSMIIDQLETGKIELTADYIYNQVPIELVNFISAEQGRNLQELTLLIPLADIMQQVSPEILIEKMPENREDSKWASEAEELSEKIGFDEKTLGEKQS